MFERLRKAVNREPDEPGEMPAVPIEPIGVVRNNVQSTNMRDWSQLTSRIVLRPDLAPALLGLDGFSHILVLSWLHRIPDEVRGSKLQLHPRDDDAYPLMGILATRSQIRPNPIACTVVQLLEVKENVLKVRGLDNIDGTPVLDIKPYVPHYDGPQATVPDWVWRPREEEKL